MMMTIYKNLCWILTFFTLNGYAQGFTYRGKVTYERKIQIHKVLQENQWAKDHLNDFPKFEISSFSFTFNPDTSLYSKNEETVNNPFSWAILANATTVTTFFKTQKQVVRKNIMNDDYTIMDTIKSYSWKIGAETRTIAGVECRKATTIIYDSIYVVAFYADQIPVSGGPEQFGGLPGLILGLNIPKLHVSYYATKLESQSIPPMKLPKTKGKGMSRLEYQNMILKNLQWLFSNSPIGSLFAFI